MVCMRIKTSASTGRIPAGECVNIRANVTCGFANMVDEVAKILAPTKKGIINDALSVLVLPKIKIVNINMNVAIISET